MKVLIINGSPKGGRSNTYRLAKAFAEGAGAQTLNVFAEKIEPCRGCFACWNKTPGKCVIKDPMGEILNKIIGADVIIWTFPLYYFSVPGPLKNLLDRLLPLCLPFMSGDNESGAHFGRYDLSGQRRAVISTCGFWTAAGNYGGVEAIFDRLYGADGYSKIFCGQGGLFRVPELKDRTDAYLDIVRGAGAEFSAAGKIGRQTQAELREPLFDRQTYEKMADAS